MKRNWIPATALLIAAFTMQPAARAHCQIPCGIYNDAARFTLMREHVATIEKSMKAINELKRTARNDPNQLVRWVHNKEEHAGELAEIITYYFMTQRVKPSAETDPAGFEAYQKQLTALHRMLVTAMKAKQSTDLHHCTELNRLIQEFERLYLQPADQQPSQ